MGWHRWILRPVVATVLLLAVLASGSISAGAQDSLTLPGGTMISGSPGDVIELGRIPVDTPRAGPRCSWTATVTNQSSVHPLNDILIESNGVVLLLADVEATPNKVTSNTGSVYLADEVVVSLRLGTDGLFSGGMQVTITYDETCQPVETTTTTELVEAEDTTPTSETSTTASTTETEPEGPEVTEPEGPEVTEPEGPDVSATESTTTSTEAVEAPATTPTTTPTAPDTLPVTGSELTLPLVGAGLALLIVGLGLVTASRQRES